MRNENRHFRKPDPVVLTLCVLVLISCLGAVGRQGRQRAKAMACLANLQQWGSMFQAYTDDHDGNFNPGWDVGETALWMNALRPYYRDRFRLLLCPTATKLPEFGGVNTFAAWTRTTSVPGGGSHRYVSSYGINSWTNHMSHNRGARLREWFWGTTRGVPGAGRIPVLADATWHDAWPLATDTPFPVPVDFGGGNMGISGEINHFCIDRHLGAVNFLFMDWSARKVSLKELWTLKWHRSYNITGLWTVAGGAIPADWPEWMHDFKGY